MAVSTDPLQRDRVGIISRDTGDRIVAPTDNSALRLGRSLAGLEPALHETVGVLSAKFQADAEVKAKAKALETSGAKFADAVRLGQLKPTQNPWFIDAYEREAAALRGTDAMGKLQTDSQSWAERTNPAAFAKKWHDSVAEITKQFDYSPEAIKGFAPAEAQATQQVLATNQSLNAQRIAAERQQNLSALASDAVQRVVQAGGGHASGSQLAAALQPAKVQWVATGGSLEDWNKIAISAITTASYSIRSPGLLDALKDPALIIGPKAEDTSQYGDGVDGETPDDIPDALAPLPGQPDPKASGPLVSTGTGRRLQPPAVGPTVAGGTYNAHLSRKSHGVDIALPIGSKLTTPIAGVATIGHDARSGLFVRVVSPDGKIVSSVAHLSLAQVTNGQQVAAGAIIARSGNSGHTTGPHVHWRLRVDGKDVDPTKYEVAQDTSDQAHSEAAAGNQAPELAPAPIAPAAVTIRPSPLGPSLYDIAGVADQVESDRYRIKAAVNGEAGDKLQAILNGRKLKALEATDRLYATFGTDLLLGNVSGETIVNSLKGQYDPQTIAFALNSVQESVSNTSALANARLSIQGNQPGQAKKVFDLAVRARTDGWNQGLEDEAGAMVISGELTASEGSQIVGEAVSRSTTLRAQQRQDAISGTPGSVIKGATGVKRGIDYYTSMAMTRGRLIVGRNYKPTEVKILNDALKNVVQSWLATHPGDWAGAEQAARDFTANYLTRLQASHGTAKPASPAPASGGNPRR